MMKNMMSFHDEAQKAISQGHAWSKVREATGEIQSELRSMKFELPDDGEEKVVKKVSYDLFHYSLKNYSLLTFQRSTRTSCRR